MGGADQREAATLRIGDVAPCGGLASAPLATCRHPDQPDSLTNAPRVARLTT